MRKSKRTLVDEGQRSAEFRWEFLRRGEAYKEAFRKFKKKYPDYPSNGWNRDWLVEQCLKRGEDPRNPAANHFMTQFLSDLHEFRPKWGIDPTDPTYPHSPFLRIVHWVMIYSTLENPSELVVNMDTGSEIEVLDAVKLAYRTYHAKKSADVDPPKQKKKHYFDLYPAYLKVHDLHESGMKPSEIAKSEPAISRPDNQGDPVKRVSEYIIKAKQLILWAISGKW